MVVLGSNGSTAIAVLSFYNINPQTMKKKMRQDVIAIYVQLLLLMKADTVYQNHCVDDKTFIQLKLIFE